MSKYYKGDKVWFVGGYSLSGLIAIHCTILEVDEGEEASFMPHIDFYDLDEPIGHDVAEWEVYDTREEAAKELHDRVISSLAHSKISESRNYQEERDYVPTLDKFRNSNKRFIDSTWQEKIVPENDEPFVERAGFSFPTYPDKKENEEWFVDRSVSDQEIKNYFKAKKKVKQ